MSNVFIPTNPHDKILTDAERQKWESDLDNKKDDFPYIALTKAQLKLLKQARTDAVLITAHNENDADVLCCHSFAYCLVTINYLEGHKMLCEEENHAILIRERLKSEVLSLTDSQAEYVLWRLECLLQEEN